MSPDEYVNTKPAPKPKPATDAGSEPSAASSPPARRKKKKSLYDRLDLTRFVQHETVIRHMPFILFIALLALLYIWNNHYAVKSVRIINKNEKEIKQLKWEYLTSKSELEGKSKQSEVARLVEPHNIKELKAPPVKIYVDEQRN
ncbi:MAG TPA: FtsL-like putative cell division protein [Chitinophagales bacterium]|nr:FtsL-like putative cell division protein [Chitinophagales bacterium]